VTLGLDEIEVTGIDAYPATESVRLHGPPGTGKTTQSAARVALLLRDHDFSIEQVAWATYRRSLANDTLERLVEWNVLDPDELEQPTRGSTRFISTIHAIANRAVGGLPDPVESWHKTKFCKEMGLRYRTKHPWQKSAGKELFRFFGWMKGNCFDPGDPDDLRSYPHLADLTEQYGGSVHEAWRAWETFKQSQEVIDFWEMLEAAIETKAVPTTDVLVIDEYHDATPLMARVCELWMDAAEIVIVAGDPHQVVNQYDGASPYFFERLDYPKVLLDKSYRVGRDHWVPASRILSKAHDSPDVEPSGRPAPILEYNSPPFALSEDNAHGWNTPAPGSPGSPSSIVEQATEGEAEKDILFLARTRMQADGVGAALERAGIVYHSQRNLNGWNTSNASSRLALFNGLQKIRGYTRNDFTDQISRGFDQFQDDRPDPSTVYLSTAEASNLLRTVSADHLQQSRKETNDIRSKITAAEQPLSFEEFDQYVTPEFWAVYTHGPASENRLNKASRSDRARAALRVALQNYDGPVDPESSRVGVMTVHASKGQEAADVVIYDGITKRVNIGMMSDEESRKNEWRTWYVALTRASERLHIMRGGFEWTTSILPANIREMVPDTRPETVVEVAPESGVIEDD
jgi:DNA helicase-2/ATP-dependent DNA helicase PcrA